MSGFAENQYISMIEYICYVALVALCTKFILTLAEKWGVLEWIQVNAPNEFFYKLSTCNFCQSFWVGLCLSILLAIFVDWVLIFIPIFSSSLR